MSDPRADAVEELRDLLDCCSGSNKQFRQWRLVSEQTIRIALEALSDTAPIDQEGK